MAKERHTQPLNTQERQAPPETFPEPSKKHKKLTPERENEIMDNVLRYTIIAESGSGDENARQEKNLRYVNGNQGDPQQEAWNEATNQVSLTIPLVRPQVNQLVGQVIENPKDITMINHHGGMKLVADLKSALIKHAMSSEAARFELTNWFTSGVNTNAGYFGVFLDRTRDPLYADLEMKMLDTFDVMRDPSVKTYDWNSRGDGAKFVQWSPWIDLDLVKATYPDKWDEIGTTPLSPAGVAFGHVRSLVNNILGRGDANRARSSLAGVPGASEDFNDLKMRILHTWWVEYQKVFYFYDLTRDDEPEPLILIEDEEIADARKAVRDHKNAFALRTAITPLMNHTISSHDTLLENRIDELNLLPSGRTAFPIVPFFPYFNSGYVSSPVDDMIGPQDFINESRSAVMNNLRGQSNRGWFVDSDLLGMQQWLANHGAEDGIVIDRSKFGGNVESIQPPPLDKAHETMVQVGKQELQEITGIRTERPQGAGAREGWQTVTLKQEASQTGTSPITHNFDHSLHILGGLLDLIVTNTKVYALNEITSIVEDKDLIDPQLLNEMRHMVAASMGIQVPEPIEVNNQQIMEMPEVQRENFVNELERAEIERQSIIQQIDGIAKPIVIQTMLDAMRNPRKGQYYASVSTSQAAPSARVRQQAETLEVNAQLINAGYPGIPPKYIIENSDMPRKEEILADMEGQQGQRVA